jgi:hypothetical protein
MFIYKKVFHLAFALSVWTSEGSGGAKPSEPVRTAVAIIENGNYQICAGTILSNYWVLAAKQCFQRIRSVPPKENVIQLYIRVSVVLIWSLCRKEMEKMISNLDSAEFQQLLQLREI